MRNMHCAAACIALLASGCQDPASHEPNTNDGAPQATVRNAIGKIAYQIAFYRTDGVATAVYVVNADGTGETKLTDDPAMADALGSFAPHGRQIAFSRDPVGPGDARPWIMNADGSDARPIPIPPALLAGGRYAHPYDWSHH